MGQLTGQSYVGMSRALQSLYNSDIGVKGRWEISSLRKIQHKLRDICFKHAHTHQANLRARQEDIYSVGDTLLHIDMTTTECRLLTLIRQSPRATTWQCMATECADQIPHTTTSVGFIYHAEHRTREGVPQESLQIWWAPADGSRSSRQDFTLIDGRRTWWVSSNGKCLLKALPFKLV